LKPLKIITILYVICLSFPLLSMTMADKEEYEKLGLSQVEWDMIQKSHMSKGKLHHLLKCGISIPEYFKSPWDEVKLSENEWLRRRCAGQSSTEIRTSEQNEQSGIDKVSSGEWTPIQSFFLPGLNQVRRNQKLKGYFMSGIAVASLGFFIIHSATAKSIQPIGLLFLVPDMLWSGIDMGIQIGHENNPDADRFSSAHAVGAVALTIRFTLP
jgi:hypothetical protein